MTKKKAPAIPASPFAAEGEACHRVGEWLWIPLRNKWVNVTHQPEEVVRQEWVRRLVVDGGYDLGQLEQEVRSLKHGHGSPRADIVVWPSPEAKASGKQSILVVETKAAEGPVLVNDFIQGNSYARVGGAGFLICATATAHKVFELPPSFPADLREINDWPRKADFADAKRLKRLRESLRVFDRDEFQKLLVACHNLLRDAHAMSPDQAFDTISKVLFIKLNIERTGSHGTFTTQFIDDRERTRLPGDKPVHESLFESTKAAYAADDLFDEKGLEISDATFNELVSKLERFNLSQTGEDVKGIAFEQFLGRTFRGELGQFFTPRPVVNFMIDALDPQEGETICDPATGSGGFLIRAFDHVRDRIVADVNGQKKAEVDRILAEYPASASEDDLNARDERIEKALAAFNADLAAFRPDGTPADTRVGALARDCIYGTDKESRAARTAKMNMIMHGDGHGGIHWHDGLLDINGIWEDRFNVVVTNPPFGSTVKKSAKVGDTPLTFVPETAGYVRRQNERYGTGWLVHHENVLSSKGKPILSLYEVGEGRGGNSTSILFLERCLKLLQPGGRMAIILPNGNLNGASLAWLRRWAEGKAFLRGVVALPMETFRFSGASVSASIVFLDRFSDDDAERWEETWEKATAAVGPVYAAKRASAIAQFEADVVDGGDSQLKEILVKLRALGGDRVLPDPTTTAGQGLERAAVTTAIGAPRWTGQARGEAADLRRRYTERAKRVPRLVEAMAQLKAALSALDVEGAAATWEQVRALFDYPVFMARPTAVGITGTGETGAHIPNDLPQVLEEYQQFRKSLEAGAP